MPSSDATSEMFLDAIDAFETAGYQFIGLDHFARPNDKLAQAETAGSLRRSFQGMTTGAGLDVLGFGPSAISILSDAYAQNARSVADWHAAITGGGLATRRGIQLSAEDRIRQAVIEQLYCYGRIDKQEIDARFHISFDAHFADELSRLGQLEADGLVVLSDAAVGLTFPLGRLLVRVVAAVFDAYLPRNSHVLGQSTWLASKVG
jgi:oxygen-independent coproporphyrinogen-3 oxidase